MGRTYFFMGWNRDTDYQPVTIRYMPPCGLQGSIIGCDVGRASYSMPLDFRHILSNRYFTPHGYVIQSGRKIGLCMAVVKGDDSEITWDATGMELEHDTRRKQAVSVS